MGSFHLQFHINPGFLLVTIKEISTAAVSGKWAVDGKGTELVGTPPDTAIAAS